MISYQLRLAGRCGWSITLFCQMFGRGDQMLRWAILFLIVALVAAVFGFGGIAADAAWIAKILFVVFLILFVVSFVMGRRGPGA